MTYTTDNSVSEGQCRYNKLGFFVGMVIMTTPQYALHFPERNGIFNCTPYYSFSQVYVGLYVRQGYIW